MARPDALESARLGFLALHVLLVIQVALAASTIAAQTQKPFSRSRDLGQIISAQPMLRRAIVIGDPDYLIEPLPYYSPQTPVWRIRFSNKSSRPWMSPMA